VIDVKDILSANWLNHEQDTCPIDRRLQNMLAEVDGMGTENICFLINEVCRQVAEQKGACRHLELGVYRGRTLISAVYGHQRCSAVGVDDFSQFDKQHSNEKACRDRLDRLKVNAVLYNMKFTNYIKGLKDDRFDTFYSDGEHTYDRQMESFRIAMPFLAQECFIFVDDLNYTQVERSNNDFLKEFPGFKSVFRIKAPRHGDAKWWNGFEVFQRGTFSHK